MLVSVYIALGIAGELPSWLVILVVFRDVTIVGGFLLIQAVTVPKRFDPLYISKINTGVQIALVAFVLGRLGLDVEPGLLDLVLCVVVAVTTVSSGASYLVRWARILAHSEQAL
jgi:cardiolipin synthase